MALSDLLSFFTSDATAKYNEKPYSKEAARKPLLAGIKRARDDFNNDEFTKPNRWFSVKNKHVEFHPKLKGVPLVLNGVEKNHMPSERFVEFLDLMEKEVNNGEFDDLLRNHGEGNVDVHIPPAKRTRAPASGLGNKAQPNNAEWMAKFVEKYGTAPGDGYVPNSKGTRWVSAANAARGKKAKGVS